MVGDDEDYCAFVAFFGRSIAGVDSCEGVTEGCGALRGCCCEGVLRGWGDGDWFVGVVFLDAGVLGLGAEFIYIVCLLEFGGGGEVDSGG